LRTLIPLLDELLGLELLDWPEDEESCFALFDCFCPAAAAAHARTAAANTVLLIAVTFISIAPCLVYF
jgi:hypothetical protein